MGGGDGSGIVPAEGPLIVDRPAEGLAILTLNRPEKLNALSLDLRRALMAAVARLDDEGDTRVIILTGAGRAFCAGLDLAELAHDSQALNSIAMDDPVAALRRFSGVVIGAINGPAITGGFELALACDILIADETARFADTHAKVGVLPGWQLSQRLSRTLGIYRAKQISLAGHVLAARQAEAWGLVGEVVPAGQLLTRARALAETMLDLSPGMLRAYKRVIDDGYAQTLAAGIAIEGERAATFNASVTSEAIAASDPRPGAPRRPKGGNDG